MNHHKVRFEPEVSKCAGFSKYDYMHGNASISRLPGSIEKIILSDNLNCYTSERTSHVLFVWHSTNGVKQKKLPFRTAFSIFDF
jgi:hypothetical protein